MEEHRFLPSPRKGAESRIKFKRNLEKYQRVEFEFELEAVEDS